jgi:transcriptional regulator with XRE-family HTH domain
MPSDLKRLLGKRLAALRESRGLKQHQLARLVGKKDTYISAIERGQNFPRPEMISMLARVLHMPVSALFFFEGMDDDPKALRKQIDGLLDNRTPTQLRRVFRQMLVSLEE